MFSSCTVPPDGKETELGSSNQEASPSAGKNTGIVLVPCCTWKCVPTVSLCYLLRQMSSQWGSQKLLQGLVSHELTAYHSVFNLFLTLWIMVILSKGCKPDKFESHNSQKLSFMNIWGLCSNFVECESFLESNSSEIFAQCETNLDDSIDSGNFPVRVYLPLIWKDSITHMHGLAVDMKGLLFFAQDLFLDNFANSNLCFQLALLHSVSYFFFLYWSPSSFLHSFWFYFIWNRWGSLNQPIC